MPRQGRIHIVGGIYHIMQRGIERRDIFNDEEDREEFLDRLSNGLKETNHKCYAWSLMPNHFHLLIRSGNKTISELMRKLLTGYAMYFNRKYKRSGYLYQNRYKSILSQEDSYLLELVRYIHLNPLRAKMVKDVKELNEYKWSGHSVLMGNRELSWQSTGEILERFGRKRKESIKKYAEFIEDGKEIGRKEEYSGGGLKRSFGGWSGVMALRKMKEYHRSDERIIGDGEFVEGVLKEAEEKERRKEKLKKEGWNLGRIAELISREYNIKKEEIKRRSRQNKQSEARKVLMYIASKELGISGIEIANYLGISGVAVTKGIREGEKLTEKGSLKLIS